MEPPVEIDELMERIRAAVRAQHQDDAAPARAPLPIHPPIPASLSTVSMPPGLPGAERERAALELALAEAASLIPRAGRKTQVRKSVPKIFRPLYRNQGGFNGIVLEAMERLLEANQQLRRQNVRFQEQLDGLETALKRQHDWIAAAAHTHEQHREWMLAVESYLVEIGGSPPEVQQRLLRWKTDAAARQNTPS